MPFVARREVLPVVGESEGRVRELTELSELLYTRQPGRGVVVVVLLLLFRILEFLA